MTLSLGTVQAVGKDVETLRVGTRVVVFPWIGCGQCSRCKQGHDNFCDGAPPIPHPLSSHARSPAYTLTRLPIPARLRCYAGDWLLTRWRLCRIRDGATRTVRVHCWVYVRVWCRVMCAYVCFHIIADTSCRSLAGWT